MTLKQYLNYMHKSLKTAAIELETSYENMRRYANGMVMPRIKTMKRINKWSDGFVQPADFYQTEKIHE